MIFTLLFVCAVWLFIAMVIYFVPVVVAYIRKHNNILAITILTLFLGWTFFGWLAALLWSLNSDIREEED
ncbi:superinfection immunity protein [bacterium]|nr:superinfection immunity protein [bacterium]MBQ9150032.1 superinfection immunity protein [bacterium]